MPRGFAALSPAQRREVARLGGVIAHKLGKGHEYSPEEAKVAGVKGVRVVSADREHMAAIGSRGGTIISADREHMAEIGRRGGQSRARKAAAACKP